MAKNSIWVDVTKLPLEEEIHSHSDGIRFFIEAKPNSKKESVTQRPDGKLILRIHAPPVEGKANARIIEVLAEVFSLAKSSIGIAKGSQGRSKEIHIKGLKKEEALERLLSRNNAPNLL